LFINVKIRDIRINPYVPSLSRTPARIIEPATGASTWALGSQRWRENMGIFTRKAKIKINHQIFIIFGKGDNQEDIRKER
jgi:ABC-type phosphate transport system permease subunit